MIADLGMGEFRIIITGLLGILILILLIKLATIVLPKLLDFGENTVLPDLQNLGDTLVDKGTSTLDRVEDDFHDFLESVKPGKKEVHHHHYAPQNVQTTTTQNFTDSVIIDRSQGGGSPGVARNAQNNTTRNITDSVIIDRGPKENAFVPSSAPGPVLPVSKVAGPRCPNCGEGVKTDWSVCPRCTLSLR